MSSSASSAVRRIATKRGSSCSRSNWRAAQVEQIGILIRSEARLIDGRYAFSERQANQILDLRLYQLTGLESDKITSEYNELLETIKDLLDILAKEARVFEIIKDELREIQEKYADPRLTQLVPDEGEIAMEDLIANEGMIISITHNGFIKRTAVAPIARNVAAAKA